MTYKVSGHYTISFEREIEADSYEEAEEIAYATDFMESADGTSIFNTEGIEMRANSVAFDIDILE